jgi:hypothetical protein
MKRVAQRTTTDCGIAAVAMVARTSYRQAKAAFPPFKGRGFRTSRDSVGMALRKFGLAITKGRRRISTRTAKIDLDVDALLLVDHRPDGDFHWIVWDCRSRRVLDPATSHPSDRYKTIAAYRVRPTAGSRRAGVVK